MADGKEGKSASSVRITAPTYNDLVSLVERLTTQLKAADNSAAVLDELGKLKSSNSAKVEADQKMFEPREPLEFRVVSDLAKGVEKFHGRETSVMAEDWLLAVKGLASVNAWPFSYTLQYLRMQVEAAAKDWFMGHSFCDWTEFEKKFGKTFVRASSVSDRLDLMKARKQGKNEALMDYFQPKMRMWRELSLSLRDSKDYLLRGLYARNLVVYVVGQKKLVVYM